MDYFDVLGKNFFLNPNPSNSEIDLLKEAMCFKYPIDYFAFISSHNGGEGELGEGYLALWSIKDMIETNSIQKTGMPEFYDKYWIFGSNSGVFQYVFDKKNGLIIEIDPYEENHKVVIGETFQDFITDFKNKV
ncbi:MAG TPA: SMI1/KNR4 family protein [Saprospiraceae bacterium]|nr:SMI1/KNR4 family protein [Saprospiraceae bacterium]HMP25226.1 SMI1/KNR4 family protein [Saprospiraceae bacterium]